VNNDAAKQIREATVVAVNVANRCHIAATLEYEKASAIHTEATR